MPLPVVSGRRAVAAFEKVGFVFSRQQGSHLMLINAERRMTISVPNHREIRTGTLRTIIRQAGLTVNEFVELLR
jgi:predicted RNA binding protein YcfA (HicA-like mRNA interferase family)